MSKINSSLDFSALNKNGLMKYWIPSSPTKKVSKYFFPDLLVDGFIEKQPLTANNKRINEINFMGKLQYFKSFFTNFNF